MILSHGIKLLLPISILVFYLSSGQVDATGISDNLTEIAVTRVPENIYLRVNNDPTDEVWHRVPEYSVTLNMAPPVHPSVALRHTVKKRQSQRD